jgi:hypothetical protein
MNTMLPYCHANEFNMSDKCHNIRSISMMQMFFNLLKRFLLQHLTFKSCAEKWMLNAPPKTRGVSSSPFA